MITNLTEREQSRQLPYFYWLLQVAGIGDRTILRLLEQVEAPEQIYFAKDKQLEAWQSEGILLEKQVQNLKRARRMANLYSAFDKLQKEGISLYPFYHPEYPEKLRGIPDCPAALFVKGTLPDPTKKSLAVIGARSCSAYGRRMAEEFAGTIGQAGIQIISGMARGVDGISQTAALQAGGRSFGVLGCGVDICYPPQNRALYGRLIQQGGVLSSYLPGTRPQGQLFPPRNRIISGLADALLVIEAREKSGTLITVDMALEQGREVYALPGRVGDAISEGTNRLIAQGAGIALSPEALLEELLGGMFSTADSLGKKVAGKKVTGKQAERLPAAFCNMTEREQMLYGILDDYPKSMETIRRELPPEITYPELMELLVKLCVKGVAEQLPGGNIYRRC